MLCCSPVYSPIQEGIGFLSTYGICHAVATRSGVGTLVGFSWGCMNVLSCLVIGIGVLRAHRILLAIGGCVLVVSTLFYLLFAFVFHGL